MSTSFYEIFAKFSRGVKGADIEEFFRISHHPRMVCKEQMSKHPGATMLRQPVPTMWGSKVSMRKSLLVNRLTVPASFTALKLEKFNSEACNGLGWVCLAGWWSEAANLLPTA